MDVSEESISETSKNNAYVYLHLRESNGSVFYVGKGTFNRAWDRRKRTQWWRNIVAKHGLSIIIVKRDMSEACAFSLERALIRAYHGQLCNLTDGGEGSSGYKHTAETRAKLSVMKKGKKPPPLSAEARAKIAKANTGRKMSDEARAKMSAAWVGRVITPEWRAKLTAAQKGRPHSKEHVENQAAAQRGKKLSEEHKKAIGDFHRGKTISEAHLAAMSKKIECGNGMSFPSVSAAARWVKDKCGFPKANKTNIIYCLKGVTASAYGFTWRYL